MKDVSKIFLEESSSCSHADCDTCPFSKECLEGHREVVADLEEIREIREAIFTMPLQHVLENFELVQVSKALLFWGVSCLYASFKYDEAKSKSFFNKIIPHWWNATIWEMFVEKTIKRLGNTDPSMKN